MKTIRPALAVAEVFLILPAALFMIALFLRDVQPLAETGRLVDWYSHHVVLGLDVFLVAMPLAALVAGAAVLWHHWRRDSEFRRVTLEMFAIARAHAAPLVITATTLVAGSVLVIVAMHMITE